MKLAINLKKVHVLSILFFSFFSQDLFISLSQLNYYFKNHVKNNFIKNDFLAIENFIYLKLYICELRLIG